MLEEAIRQETPSPAPRSALLLYSCLLALLHACVSSTDGEIVARVRSQLKQRFQMSATAIEVEQASLRGAFEKCTGNTETAFKSHDIYLIC